MALWKQNLPEFASVLMSYCIMVRCVWLNVLSFFLRWISSIFHGGISEWLVVVVVVAVAAAFADAEAISISYFSICFSLLFFALSNSISTFDSLVQMPYRRSH